MANSITRLGRQQIIIHKRLGGFRSELHHHSCRSVCIHVGVLARHIVFLGSDNLQENVMRLRFTRYIAFIAICDICFGYFLAGRLHELHFHLILNLVNRHYLFAGNRNTIHNALNQCFIFALLGNKHGFAYSCLNFFFIKTDDAAVTFAYSLYHNSIFFVGLLDQC